MLECAASSFFTSPCLRGEGATQNLLKRCTVLRALRAAHTGHRGKVAVRLAAIVVLDSDIVAQGVHKARLPIARVIFRVVNGDDVLKLGWACLADTLDRTQLVGVRRAGGVHEGLLVETGG